MTTTTEIEITIPTASLRAAIEGAVSVAPKPKGKTLEPVEHLKLDVSTPLMGQATAVLIATDKKLGARWTLDGVEGVGAGESLSVLLPPEKLQQIVKATRAQAITLTALPDRVKIKAGTSRYELGVGDPAYFPDVPEFDPAMASLTLSAVDLQRLIRRTVFAVESKDTRHALAGCLFEPGDGTLTLVGTDSRRLARMTVPAVGSVAWENAVVPERALRLVDRFAEGKPDAQVQIDPKSHATFLMGDLTLWTRLAEGKFPNWRQSLPEAGGTVVESPVADLLLAVQLAAITTSEESRGIDLTGLPGAIQMTSKAADVGSARVEHEVGHEGEVTSILDPSYLIDCLEVLDEDAVVSLAFGALKDPVTLRTNDGYEYVISQLVRK